MGNLCTEMIHRNAWCGCPPCEAVHDVGIGAVRRALFAASVYDKYCMVHIHRFDWTMSDGLCGGCYIYAAHRNGRLQCEASPFVEMYALTYFDVMHLHFCFEHCLRCMPRCSRVIMGARQFSFGQNLDSQTTPSCMHMQYGTGMMVWVNARCDCEAHDSQLPGMHGESISTKCVHTYKTVPEQLQFELLVRERPQIIERDLAAGVCIPHMTDVVSM